MAVTLIRPYSIWVEPLSADHKKKNIIATFKLENGMWKEFNGCVHGISKKDMEQLISAGYAIRTPTLNTPNNL